MAKALEKQHLTERAASGVRHVTIAEDFAGVRLDKFLARQFPEVPRSRLFRIVRKGEVRINGSRARVDQRLAAGDVVRLPPLRAEAGDGGGVAYPSRTQSGGDGTGGEGGGVAAGASVGGRNTSVARVPRSLVQTIVEAIVQEDERLIVVNKPAGVAVHGGSGISFGVIEALRAALPAEADSLELVHRLDRDTSGVLLVARKSAVLRMLHAQLREGHEFEKRYLALVKGSWQLGQKRIDAPLRTDLRVGGERTVRVQAGGKASISEFRPVQFFGPRATLLEVGILTGRTHQIRVHAAYAGHPIAGDDKYGDREFNAELAGLGLKRMFLHASSVSFTWPDRGTAFSVNAPLPPELGAVIDALATATPARRRRGPRRR